MSPMTKKIVAVIGGTLALLAAAQSANAQSDAEAFDSCKPHEWDAFAAAVERSDMVALQQMIASPELGHCGTLVATALVLVCEADPLACIEPAAGHDDPVIEEVPPPPVIVIECPTWKEDCTDPLPPPGAHVGIEGDDDEDGGDRGGSTSAAASSSTGGGSGGGSRGGASPSVPR